MTKIENMCCGCDIPCIDCGRKRTEVTVCDRCETETTDPKWDGWKTVYGEDLCPDCYEKLYGEES